MGHSENLGLAEAPRAGKASLFLEQDSTPTGTDYWLPPVKEQDKLSGCSAILGVQRWSLLVFISWDFSGDDVRIVSAVVKSNY